MRQTLNSLATLAVFLGLLTSATPGAACGACNCHSVQHIVVTCGACDKQIDTYPIQAGSSNSCTAYALTILYCCDDKNVPETSSHNVGACGGNSCPIGLTCLVKGKGPEQPLVNEPGLTPGPQRH